MKQRLYQIALNLLSIGEDIYKLEEYHNKKGGHRCITVNPRLKLHQTFYLNDSCFNIKEEDIVSQIESNLDEIKDLLYSIITNMKVEP